MNDLKRMPELNQRGVFHKRIFPSTKVTYLLLFYISWSIEYYSSDIERLILELPKGLLAGYLRLNDLMIEFGANLSMPHTVRTPVTYECKMSCYCQVWIISANKIILQIEKKIDEYSFPDHGYQYGYYRNKG